MLFVLVMSRIRMHRNGKANLHQGRHILSLAFSKFTVCCDTLQRILFNKQSTHDDRTQNSFTSNSSWPSQQQ